MNLTWAGVETDSSNHNTADRNEVEIRTAGRRIGKKTVQVRRTAAVLLNALCFKDVIAEGRRKLETRELHIVNFIILQGSRGRKK